MSTYSSADPAPWWLKNRIAERHWKIVVAPQDGGAGVPDWGKCDGSPDKCLPHCPHGCGGLDQAPFYRGPRGVQRVDAHTAPSLFDRAIEAISEKVRKLNDAESHQLADFARSNSLDGLSHTEATRVTHDTLSGAARTAWEELHLYWINTQDELDQILGCEEMHRRLAKS